MKKISLVDPRALFLVIPFMFCESALAVSIANAPLYLTNDVPPNVLLNVSVETPMGGAAYNDQATNGLATTEPRYCEGRHTIRVVDSYFYSGSCYSNDVEFVGYFDPDKCYEYSSSGGHFYPSGLATNRACSGKFSGNFMNWASMTAMDMFILTMTGGNRVVDTNSGGTTYNTVIQRARKYDNDWWFPKKILGRKIRSTASGVTVNTSSVTPWNKDGLLIENTAFGVRFTTLNYSNSQSRFNTSSVYNYNLKVAACVDGMLEGNCVRYGSIYKPEGLIQEKSSTMRFGVSAYLNDDGNARDGGVIRALMKSVGRIMPDGTSNTAAEINTDGTLVNNPDGISGVTDSGVIQYLNRFSELAQYKSRDPVSELYYESLRYLMGKGGPTAEYVSNHGPYMGGMPVHTTWDDPWQYSCQQSFIVGLNDANPWTDKRVPGTSFTSDNVGGHWISDGDYGEPSSAAGFTAIRPGSTTPEKVDVSMVTDWVGYLQGINGTSQYVGCVIGGTCNNNNNLQTITSLGNVMGTYPAPQKQNSYYVAGMAYMANTWDLRPDLDGVQSVKTYMIDSQEYAGSPLVGQMNMLWLAGKFGGFNDTNDNSIPDLAEEWDSDNDGEPDNYVLATDSSRMIAALKESFADIEKRTTSSSTVAANSSQLDIGTTLFQARYDSSDWSGNLVAFPINPDGSLGDALWEAADELPGYATRKIVTRNDNSPASGILFNWSSLTASQQALLNQDKFGNTDGLGEKRVDFVRGDLNVYDTVTPNFRFREAVLGDIVNSNPLYVSTPDFGFGQYYSGLGDSVAVAYRAFRNSSAYRNRPAMIYAGGNDGMLHAFNAQTGQEEFAYIPSEVIARIPELTDNRYSHKYYVDGSPRSSDAYLGGSWKTILVGATAAGGRSVYALDITNPTSFGTGDVMWEYSSADDSDMGNVLGSPTITKLDGGDWVALVGNGPNGNSQEAVLFVIRLSDGALLQKISTAVGDAANPNGLFAPVPVDVDGDRDADYIYAGDMLGNLWKFDPDDWSIKQRLFTACDNAASCTTPNGHQQPITVRPTVIAHPDQSGLLIMFGTGRYFATGDDTVSSNPRVEAFYGIYDNGDGTTVTKAQLVAQSILLQDTTASGVGYRVVSNNEVNYSSARGWYLPLLDAGATAGTGERVVSDALVHQDRVIFTTMTPDPDPCSFGGTSWLMELDVTTGGRLSYDVLDTNSDGDITDADSVSLLGEKVPVSGVSKQEIIKTPTIVGAGTKEYKYSSGSSGGVDITLEKGTGEFKGRQSWKQLR